MDAGDLELLHMKLSQAIDPLSIRVIEIENAGIETLGLVTEMRAMHAEMASLLAQARGAAMAAENAVSDVVAEAESIAGAASEAVEGAIDTALTEAENAVSDTVDESESLIDDLPDALNVTEDEGPDRTPLFERKLFGTR